MDTRFSALIRGRLSIVTNAPATNGALRGSTDCRLHAAPEVERSVTLGWLPNWRDQSQYLDSTASPVDWAWQFLRRDPDYQRYWSELIAPIYNPAYVDRSLQRTDGGAQDDLCERRRLRLMEHGGPSSKQAIFRERFGVITIPQDPSEPIARVRFEAQSRPPLRYPPTALKDHELLICLNCHWPIEAQLKSVKRLLAQEIKNEKFNKDAFRFRNRPAKYARYLRLLDTKVAGASDRDVAKVIYPDLPNVYPNYDGSRKVRYDRAVAERLRDSPWRIAAGAEP